MFVKINECCIINTDHVVWIDVAEETAIIHMSDDTEHLVGTDKKLNQAMNIINLKAKRG